MSTKKLYFVIGLVVILGFVYYFYPNRYYSQNSQKTLLQTPVITIDKSKHLYDTLGIKEAYESLNPDRDQMGEPTSGLPLMQVDEQTKIISLDFPSLQTLIEKETGVIYFGFPECPWCRRLLPQLIEASLSSNIPLYVYNPKEIRDQIILGTGGELVVEKEATPEYQYLLDRLNKILPVYNNLNDESIKRLYVPFVLVVKEGEIVGYHNGVLDEYTDPAYPMSPEMLLKLGSIFDRLFEATITDQTCLPDEDLSC